MDEGRHEVKLVLRQAYQELSLVMLVEVLLEPQLLLLDLAGVEEQLELARLVVCHVVAEVEMAYEEEVAAAAVVVVHREVAGPQVQHLPDLAL